MSVSMRYRDRFALNYERIDHSYLPIITSMVPVITRDASGDFPAIMQRYHG